MQAQRIMIKNLKFASSLFLLFLLLTPIAHAEKYTVGVVPQFEARRIAEIWQPLLDEVRRQSGIELELMTPANIPAFEVELKKGAYDFVYMNPYHAIVANKSQGYMPLLRDTGRNLYGIMVVRKDSPLQSVNELDGKTVAFPSPNALGAALIPRAEFANKYNIKVNEIYVKSHSSVYLNVLLGKADAGGGVQKTLAQQPAEIRDELRVLYQTDEVPSHPIASHPRVSKDIQESVVAALLEIGASEPGALMLKNIPMKKIGRTEIIDYNSLNNLGLEQFYIE